ncbi:MAG TPA: hypothetical protein ENG78_02060 [Acidiferrobacteraceae bacterium]|nr:hypothetical protein [Acidiferrobacteraceae bacterium]HEX19591.1 hypothetical protein [Acidiferrobacteraceae bacterium]
MLVGIVSALPAEAQSLIHKKPKARTSYCLSDEARLQLSGIGADRAAAAARELLQQGTVALLSWGIVGALSTDLASGDVVLPENILAQNGTSYSVDADWHEQVMQHLLQAMPCRIGSLFCSDCVIESPDRKRDLVRRTAAVAVDMESCAIAAVAKEAKVPFLAIRVVLDNAGQAIPRSAQAAVDVDGNAMYKQMLRSLLRHPGDLSAMIKLARALKKAQSTLKLLSSLLSPSFGYIDNRVAERY